MVDDLDLGRVRRAACRALGASVTAAKDAAGYVVRVEDNLLRRADTPSARVDFDRGAGNECDTKMRAPWSSAALALNAFGPWRDVPTTLRLGDHAGFDSLVFEARCPTGLRGMPPHLDVLAVRGDLVVGAESKCTEFLSVKTAMFKSAYDTIVDERTSSAWFRLIASLRASPSDYQLLDVAQLVKHSLGLAACHPNAALTLLYVYWEPLDWDSFEPFRRHRREIERFADAVGGDERVSFGWTSYSDLWANWESVSEPAWLPSHVQDLRARYDVELAPFMASPRRP